MEFGEIHDTTDTVDFCLHQLITDLPWGNWHNGFWPYVWLIRFEIQFERKWPIHRSLFQDGGHEVISRKSLIQLSPSPQKQTLLGVAFLIIAKPTQSEH